jgi:cold shock CspA family protein
MESQLPTTTTPKRYTGQVKWFNNKAGFGFVTMKNESGKDVDIFTHYSTVHVTDSQYKYLVQGEYVEFELVDSSSDKHNHQSANVTGIKGGKLMCETRQQNRPEKPRNNRRLSRNDEDAGYTKVQKKRSTRDD